MRLAFEPCDDRYVSPSQRARVLTEQWVAAWAYCPNCGHLSLEKYPNNRPVADFFCAACSEEYELKSQKTRFGARISDGEFRAMCKRLASSQSPNLMLLSYSARDLAVTDFCVVPKYFFVLNLIEKREPLAATARRAGWVGCNILLSKIPAAGKVPLIVGGEEIPKSEVLNQWQQTVFLRGKSVQARGWLTEVMRCVDLIGKAEFKLDEVYAFVPELSHRYPGNRHVKEKIRQQLQVLRDEHYLEFAGRGRYRVRKYQ